MLMQYLLIHHVIQGNMLLYEMRYNCLVLDEYRHKT